MNECMNERVSERVNAVINEDLLPSLLQEEDRFRGLFPFASKGMIHLPLSFTESEAPLLQVYDDPLKKDHNRGFNLVVPGYCAH